VPDFETILAASVADEPYASELHLRPPIVNVSASNYHRGKAVIVPLHFLAPNPSEKVSVEGDATPREQVEGSVPCPSTNQGQKPKQEPLHFMLPSLLPEQAGMYVQIQSGSVQTLFHLGDG
jgi:hypothetical protein